MTNRSVAARVVARIAVVLGLVVASMPVEADNFVVNDGGYSVDIAPGDNLPTRTILNGFNGASHFSCFDRHQRQCRARHSERRQRAAVGRYHDSGDGRQSARQRQRDVVADMVNAAGPVATTTVVTMVAPQGSGNATPTATSVFGQPVAVTVTVTASTDAVAPDGNVTVNAGGSSCPVTLGPSVVPSAATGSCTLTPVLAVAVSAYAVSASYAGTATFAASTSSGGSDGSLTVNKASTTTAISAHTPNPSNVNAPIAVTAGVAVTAPGAGTPSGTIAISDGTSNCVITLPATSCNLTPTSAGAKTLTATYGGDASFNSSVSAGAAHTVNVVTSFSDPTVNPAVTGTVTLSGGGAGCSFGNAAFIAVPPLIPPPATNFPFGLFDFTATGCNVGSTITVQIVYSQALPPNTQYWKYGPTPQNTIPHWYILPGATVNGTTVTFTIQDGQIGDDDLTANGIIVEPGGPGLSTDAVATSASIPTLHDATLAALALLIAGLAWMSLRRRVGESGN
jgi:hypothetical protein